MGYFFIAITDTLVPVMFGDAGEYYLHKEGKDTRAYMLSMSGLAGKAGFSLSTLVLGAVTDKGTSGRVQILYRCII